MKESADLYLANLYLANLYSIQCFAQSFRLGLVFALLIAVLAQQGVEAEPLRARIEHSERLAPLDSRIIPGQVFDQQSFPPMGLTTGWYRIPNWFAGNWHRETEHRKGLLDGSKSTGQSRRNERHGYQIDKLGDIWDYHVIPAMNLVDSGNTVDYKMAVLREPLAVTDKSVTLRYLDHGYTVNKNSKIVVLVYQDEEIHTWQPAGNRKLKCFASQKLFDMNGNSLNLSTATFDEELIEPFAPIDLLNGKDLKSDFKLYLMSHGLSDRVPL